MQVLLFKKNLNVKLFDISRSYKNMNEEIEKMKKRKLHLKDEIYKIKFWRIITTPNSRPGIHFTF